MTIVEYHFGGEQKIENQNRGKRTMCEMCYCSKCGAECFVCQHCGKPASVDSYVENEDEDLKFCSWHCADKCDKFQQKSAEFIARRARMNKEREGENDE